MFPDVLASSIVGGILCLDRIFLQVMISRPIVAGTVIGIILGHPQTGLVTGAMVELFWIDRSQIGTVVPPNDTVASIVIAAGTIISGKALGHPSRELIALAVLLFIPLGLLGRQVDILVMGANEKTSRAVLEDARSGRDEAVTRRQFTGLIKAYFLMFFFLLGFILIATEVLQWLYPALPTRLHLPLTWVYSFLPILGMGVALSTVHMKGIIPVFCGVFLLLTVLLDVF